MEKFFIEGIKTVSERKESNVSAENRVEAALKFKRQNPGYDFEFVGDDIILGWCEYSGKPIFDGDEYYSDSESGIMALKSEYKKDI